MKINSILTATLAFSLVAVLPGCKSESEATASPTFSVLDTTVIDGEIWLLNRPIDIFFDKAIDFNSVSTSSVIIRATNTSNLGVPVTGTYELISDVLGQADHGIRFTPSCPTNAALDNGGFVPDVAYELLLPTEGSGGFTVVRDTRGNPLSIGLTRRFAMPSNEDILFFDPKITPVAIENVSLPNGIGLLSVEHADFLVEFDQGIHPDPANLASDRIYIEYSDAGGTYPTPAQKVPGNWLIVNNCGLSAELLFRTSGVLLPGREVRLVITALFEDLSGDVNNTPRNFVAGTTPTLAELYDDIAVNPDNVSYDQFIDDYAVGSNIDLNADLAQPAVDINQGSLTASFVFPDDDGSVKSDFHISQSSFEFNTTGTQTDTDDYGNSFTINDGVMFTNDFTIEEGASIRAFGDNPLVIYVAGNAVIAGEINVSGYNAASADGREFSPHVVVLGAEGVCGGGKGGDASSVTDNTTPRGSDGEGPFGTDLGGGGGGEGGYQQYAAAAVIDGSGNPAGPEFFVVGGGGGGAFAAGRTDAIFFDDWSATDLPLNNDDSSADLRSDRHTIFNGNIDPDTFFIGAEDGMRGSSAGKNTPPNLGGPHGVHGYIDNSEDTIALGDAPGNIDQAQTGASLDTDILYGSPVSGPDGGAGGSTVFSSDTSDDFYGTRFFWDGTPGVAPLKVQGELLSPYAGSGGGASGDLQLIWRTRPNTANPPAVDTLTVHYPDTFFPHGTTKNYFRGAGGGGGGGQVQIHVLGHIVLSETTQLLVNGGNGAGGDSSSGGNLDGSTTEVSGSGGGSGGHLILSSASGLDLSSISVGVSGDPGVPGTFFNNLDENYVMQAIGGRRGWAVSSLATSLPAAPNSYDGNSTFMIGRGGAGGSGVIQIHVPNPLTDIAYHTDVHDDFIDYITAENPAGNLVISDRQDDILALYALPVPFTLIPFYSPQSQAQSVWIDTGLASLRQPSNGGGVYPDYDFGDLSFEGLDASGFVLSDGLTVDVLSNLANGLLTSIDPGGFQAIVPAASFPQSLTFNPMLLVGCDLVVAGNSHEIISAKVTTPGSISISTLVSDGEINADTNFAVRKKFFGISTGEIKDKLSSSSSVRIQFQGADGVSSDSTQVDEATLTEWTGIDSTVFDDLDGKRFIRYRITFDIDALNQGGFNSLSRPSLGYIKIPYAW